MKKLLVACLLFTQLALAKEIRPTFKLKSTGLVNDFVVANDVIYVATDAGTIDVFDLRSGKIVHQIVLDLVATKMNDLIAPSVLSVDYLNEKLLLVSVGAGVYRDVWIYENFKLKRIMGANQKLIVKEARFINNERIFLGTFGSETILHDLGENYNLYKKQLTQSAMGDVVLSEDKKTVAYSDESGEVRLVDVQSSKTLKVFSSQNVDNVYHVAYAKGVIITAGQDRRVAVYQDGEKDYHVKSDFLVYCVGISPSGKTGVYSSNEESDLQLFNTKTKQKMDKLIGHEAIVNQIKFINEKELYSSERSRYVYYWRLD